MKTLSQLKKLNYKMELEYHQNDGVYIVKFPDLPGCVAHGKTPEKALKEAISVKDEWLEIALEDGWDIKEPEKPSSESGRLTFRPPKYLQRKIGERAKQEGISINQLLTSIIAEGLEKRKDADLLAVLRGQSIEMALLVQLVKHSISTNQQVTVPTVGMVLPSGMIPAAGMISTAEPAESWGQIDHGHTQVAIQKHTKRLKAAKIGKKELDVFLQLLAPEGK